jgi:hypothetical protein
MSDDLNESDDPRRRVADGKKTSRWATGGIDPLKFFSGPNDVHEPATFPFARTFVLIFSWMSKSAHPKVTQRNQNVIKCV